MRFSRSRQRLAALHQHSGALTLTSMMDILTVLLIFILKSYVAGGDVTIPPPGVQLPKSSVEHPMGSSLVVAIDREDILVGGERVDTVAGALSTPDLLIAPLAARLREARAQMDQLASRSGSKPAGPRLVTIQGDRDIEFRVLQRVMYTVHRSGFSDVSLAVLKKS